MRHIISLKEQSREELLDILSIARELKASRAKGIFSKLLEQKTLIMLFQKSSTRTRLSFEVAMTELGGHAVYLDARTSQLTMSDFRDEIRAIMRFGHILMFRALRAADVALAASYNKIPVIDACSEKYHPAQALGDVLTMVESAGGIEKIKKVVWLGIENNVSNTLMLLCAKLGIKIAIVAPEADPTSIDKELNAMAEATGMVSRTLDLKEALSGADFVHTDTWVNMEFFADGKVKPEFSEEYERRKKLFMPYQLNAKLIDSYAPQAKIMHCMPCHDGYEISRDAIDHKNSIIFDQAENRLHVEKGMLAWLLGSKI
ncbi:MAG: ornithine carbamoyltransferase [Candidatus Liptonbacteria bacterium]|nr:ornithine carbamoyltransferase [Candidatus Liptonbacteria bacterium]